MYGSGLTLPPGGVKFQGVGISDTESTQCFSKAGGRKCCNMMDLFRNLCLFTGIKLLSPHRDLGGFMRRFVMIGLGLVAVGCAIMGFLRHDADSIDRDSLRIGYAVEAPYAYVLDNGTVTGEAPEVARVIAGRLGIRSIVWRQVDFGALIPELEDERIDVIAAGMFITSERDKRISFSEPSTHVRGGLLVARGNPHAIHSYQDLVRDSSLKAAVLSGSTEEVQLRAMGIPVARLMSVPDAVTGKVAVESGLADCLALSIPTLRWMVRSNMNGKTVVLDDLKNQHASDVLPEGYAAFAFRKSDHGLLRAWNRELRGFIGSQEHLGMIARFGFSERDLPGNTTAAEVLGR